ncbi:hypothetical protein HanPI659440_Chr00c04g0711511 [Helianthus annuus]|nr:hypothetical protein HanPI659440_Chr00c04g0711511 [Helianthus annuus]
MNCEVCQLKELDVEYFEIREVLRCFCHIRLFVPPILLAMV